MGRIYGFSRGKFQAERRGGYPYCTGAYGTNKYARLPLALPNDGSFADVKLDFDFIDEQIFYPLPQRYTARYCRKAENPKPLLEMIGYVDVSKIKEA